MSSDRGPATPVGIGVSGTSGVNIDGSTDAEGESPILWPPNVKSQFFGKDPDAGKD